MALGLHEAGKAGEEGVTGAQVETLAAALGQIVVDSGLQSWRRLMIRSPARATRPPARFGVSSLA